MQSSVILFRVHEDVDLYRDALAKLRAELPTYRVEVVSYLKHKTAATGVFDRGYIVDAADIARLPYEVRLSGFNPDDPTAYNELPVMHFFRANPGYDYYWIVEYDVHCAGRWSALFEALATSSADLLGTTIMDRSESPDWWHWSHLHWGDAPLPLEACVRAFMPFGRVSRAALTAIDAAYVDGLTGHPEGGWPTVCRMRGLTIEDIGGDGPYTPERWKNKHYWNTRGDPWLAPGSFIYRPVMSMAEIDDSAPPPMLWHPIKA
jgi:hypothetical protein